MSTEANRFFSRPAFRALASEMNFHEEESKCFKKKSENIRGTIDELYQNLKKEYRNEYFYKNEVLSKIIFGKYSPKTAGVCSELAINNTVADLVVFNGTSTAYEIKSDLDSVQRLPRQLENYISTFDLVNVVTYDALAAAVIKIAPPSVGVIVLNKRGSLSQIKSPESNVDSIKPENLFQCLRRNEFLSILKETHGWETIPPSAALVGLARASFCELSPLKAHASVVKVMRKRTTSSVNLDFLTALPYGLRALGLTQPLSSIAQKRLLSRLDYP